MDPYTILMEMTGGMFGASTIFIVILMIFFWFILIVISIGLFVLWIIALVDCIKRNDKDFLGLGSYEKLMWLLLIIFVGKITPIVYYFLVMRKTIILGKKDNQTSQDITVPSQPST